MEQAAIQKAQRCAVVLIALLLLAGCGSHTQAQRQQAASTPTPTSSAQPTPTGAASSCDAAAKQAGKAPPLISLSQYGFHPGQNIGFQGNGFQPDEEVNILLGNAQSTPASQKDQNLTSTHANNGGNVQGNVYIALMSAGRYHLYFMGQQCTVTVGIILLPFKPWVTLDNYAPFPNYRMGFQGQGFAPNEPVQVYLNTQDSPPIAEMHTDNSGRFAQNQVWNVGGDLTGQNTLLFQGMDTKVVVSVNFIVQNPATGQISPSLSHPAAAQLATASPVEAVAAGSRASRSAASAPAAASGAFLAFAIDPTLVAVGLLVLWFLLSLALLVTSLFDHIPAWFRWQRPAPLTEERVAPSAIKEIASNPTQWPPLNPRGLPTPGMSVSSKTLRGPAEADQATEDNFLAVTGIRAEQGQPHPFALLVVADSAGYYADGQSAGRKTIQTIFQLLVPALIQEGAPDVDLCAHLESALQRANRLLYWQNQRESDNSRCSVTAALISRQVAYVCNIGNSRTYLLAAGAPLRRVTTDHSIVERCVAAGIAPRDDLASRPTHSRLYRSLGQHPDAQIDTFRLPVASDDQLLLCSNGLWESLPDADLETLLRQPADAAAPSSSLVEHARRRGSSPDHITAITIKLAEMSSCSAQPGIDHIASGSSHLARQLIP